MKFAYTYIPAFIAIIVSTLVSKSSFSQGKYFEITTVATRKSKEFRAKTEPDYFGVIRPLNNQPYVILEYRGQTVPQLMQAVLKYIKERKGLWVDALQETDNGDGIFIKYGDFATIGDTMQCKANLVSKTRIAVAFGTDGNIKAGQIGIYISPLNDIYSSLYGNAQFRISRDFVVITENGLPFNIYEFVQPKAHKGLAYPESVFDQDGKIVNPVNKRIIEAFYDSYVTDLKSYLDKNLK